LSVIVQCFGNPIRLQKVGAKGCNNRNHVSYTTDYCKLYMSVVDVYITVDTNHQYILILVHVGLSTIW
jgi:hypothetical protein